MHLNNGSQLHLWEARRYPIGHPSLLWPSQSQDDRTQPSGREARRLRHGTAGLPSCAWIVAVRAAAHSEVLVGKGLLDAVGFVERHVHIHGEILTSRASGSIKPRQAVARCLAAGKCPRSAKAAAWNCNWPNGRSDLHGCCEGCCCCCCRTCRTAVAGSGASSRGGANPKRREGGRVDQLQVAVSGTTQGGVLALVLRDLGGHGGARRKLARVWVCGTVRHRVRVHHHRLTWRAVRGVEERVVQNRRVHRAIGSETNAV